MYTYVYFSLYMAIYMAIDTVCMYIYIFLSVAQLRPPTWGPSHSPRVGAMDKAAYSRQRLGYAPCTSRERNNILPAEGPCT